MVRRLRSRPHGLQGQGRRAGLRALARQRRAASPMSRSGCRPQQRGAGDEDDRRLGRTPPSIPGLARGEGGLAPGLVVATHGADYGFLDLGTSGLRSHRSRREGPRRLGRRRRLLYTERGVYRSGETVSLTALLRDAQGRRGAGPAADPRGRASGRRRVPARPGRGPGPRRPRAVAPDPAGRRCAAPGASPPTPTRRARAVGEASFLVEDYVPERLELTLCAEGARPAARAAGRDRRRRALPLRRAGRRPRRLRRGRRSQAAATQRHQGPRRLRRSGSTTRPSRPRPSRSRTRPPPTRRGASAVQVADAGRRRAAADRGQDHPARRRARRPRGRAQRDAADPAEGPGGRRAQDLQRRACARARNATFDVVLAEPDGHAARAAGNVAWTLYKVERRYQWYNSGRALGLRAGQVDAPHRRRPRRLSQPTAPARISAPVEWGTYRLDVSAPDLGETAQTSVSFTVGWSGDQTADTPDLLDMTLDKASYRAGETMQAAPQPALRRQGDAGGRQRQGPRHPRRRCRRGRRDRDACPSRPTGDRAPIVVALAHRPLDQAAKRMPGRALGIAWFAVDRASALASGRPQRAGEDQAARQPDPADQDRRA